MISRVPLSCKSGPIALERASAVLWIVVIGALPAVGLVAGPSYAALVFGLGGVQFVYTASTQRRIPQPDPTLVVFAAAFAGWCWVSAIWSMAPDRTLHGSLQLSAIFVGSLIFLSNRLPSEEVADWVFRLLPVGLAVGVLILSADTFSGYKLQLLLGHGHHSDTKYNRGLDYCVLIIWPMLAYSVRRSRWTAAAICGLMIAALAFGETSSGPAELAVGVAVFVVAVLLRDRTPVLLSAAVTAVVLPLPYLLQAFSPYRRLLVPYVKPSGIHRLEIWDYMSSHVLVHPFLGTGLLTSHLLRPTAEQAHQYLYVPADINGIYPHNQWIEMWTETGLVGVLLALGFSLLIIWRIHRCLPRDLQPFAYAAFASCLALSLVNFEVTTDSLWAAFAAVAFLFRALASGQQGAKRA